MVNRKLSTIIFIDIAGYTSLMQSDEKKALEYLTHFKETIESETLAHNGRVVQFFGDGCLLSFDSSSQALDCAMAMQTVFIKMDIPIRIGLHLGEVVFRDDNVFGDGVNIASRIESMGIPGAVLVSSAIRDQVKNKSEISLSSLGLFEFKNVTEAIEVYAVSNDGFNVPDPKKMTGKLKEKQRNFRWLSWSIPLAAVLVLLFVWYQYTSKPVSKEQRIPRLAVVDFGNSGNNIDADFTRTFTEELNNRLTGLRHLAVISRSSASAYAGTSKSAMQVGSELNVDYVLEGSIEWNLSDNGFQMLRILPELVRVDDNKKIWSGQYDENFEEAQNMQSEIMQELLRKLDIVISTEEQTMLQSSLTNNPLAYDAYQKGRKVHPPGHGAEVDFRTAFKMYKQALTLDENFTMAWIQMSNAYKDLYWYGYESSPSMLDSALVCLGRASTLEPDHPQVIEGYGDYYYRSREYDKALAEFSKVLIQRPNDSGLLQRIGELWRRQGLFDQALETLEKALELDPYNVNSITELAWTYIFVGDFDRSLELEEQARKYNPDAEWNHLMGAYILWCRNETGDLEKARVLLENVPDPQSSYPAYFWVQQSRFEHDPESILRLIKNLSTDAIELQTAYSPIELVAGLANQSLGDTINAALEFEKARIILEQEVLKTPSDFRMHMALGLAYAGLHLPDKAVASGKYGMELLPLETDHLLGLDMLYGMMRIYAILGEDDKALDVMSKLLSVPCQYRGQFFTGNPEFARLQDNPRFLDLIDKQKKMRRTSSNNSKSASL